MSKEPKVYSCPVCNKPFTSKERVGKKKNRCPNPECNVELRGEKRKIKGRRGFFYEFVVATPDQVRARPKPEPEPSTNSEQEQGRLVTDPNDNPTIRVMREGDSQEDGTTLRREFLIHFRNRIYQGLIRCPGCTHALFSNQMVSSFLDQEHVCRNNKCKAVVRVRCTVDAPFRQPA